MLRPRKKCPLADYPNNPDIKHVSATHAFRAIKCAVTLKREVFAGGVGLADRIPRNQMRGHIEADRSLRLRELGCNIPRNQMRGYIEAR